MKSKLKKEELGTKSNSNTVAFFEKPWTILTFNFFHVGVFHLIFNVLVLHFSGRLFNTYFTDKQLFGVYLLGGVFSGLTFIVLYFVLGKVSLLVGAKNPSSVPLKANPSGSYTSIHVSTFHFGPFLRCSGTRMSW